MVVVWGTGVVIPPQGRAAVLHELHTGHPGMARMKSYENIRVVAGNGQEDRNFHLNVSKLPIAASKASCRILASVEVAWTHVHIDFVRPMNGKTYLVIIDAHSKWIEAFVTTSSTSTVVIEILPHVFAQFGRV